MKLEYVTENFSKQELTRTSAPYPNIPDESQWLNIAFGAKKVLQPLRDRYKKQIIVTSCFRSKRVNEYVGGASSSQHMLGEAADITVVEKEDLKLLVKMLMENKYVDQLLAGSTWIHVSWTRFRSPRQDFRPNYYKF